MTVGFGGGRLEHLGLTTFESGVRGRLLHVDGRDRRLEAIEMHFAPRRRYRSAAHAPGTEELVICLEGDVTLGPDGLEETIGPGDALRFAADLAHSYRSERGGTALCAFSYPAVRSH